MFLLHTSPVKKRKRKNIYIYRKEERERERGGKIGWLDRANSFHCHCFFFFLIRSIFCFVET